MQAVSNAPNNNGYARVELPKPGRHRESAAYVLANCWKTVNASGCRRCLEHAAKSMLKCLPWSEARALYTGCFMRYSDTNFLNSVPSTGSSSSRDQNRGKGLNWEKRFSIIIGTAEGLVYLHENLNIRIIHRDIKASNILLDSRFQAKIADFGLARSFEDDKSHISTAIAGTLSVTSAIFFDI
nr:cysteine-rich receptor-like protein kinase 2 [Ipomoea batatas]